MNQQAMLKKLKKMQDDMMQTQHEIENTVFNATTSGVVTVGVFGTKEIESITIDESFELESKEDYEMLAEMILAACKQAYKEIDKTTEERMGKYNSILGGMNPFM